MLNKCLLVLILFLSLTLSGKLCAAEEETMTKKNIEYAPGYEREESFYDYYYGREEETEQPESKDEEDSEATKDAETN